MTLARILESDHDDVTVGQLVERIRRVNLELATVLGSSFESGFQHLAQSGVAHHADVPGRFGVGEGGGRPLHVVREIANERGLDPIGVFQRGLVPPGQTARR